MGLLIYSAANASSAFSTGDFTTPLTTAINGTVRTIIQKRYYVRNDDPLYYYTSILVQPVYSDGTNIISGTNGYSWKLIVGDTEPTEDQWSLVTPASSISIPNIGTSSLGDTSTFEPFWLRVTVPANAPIQSHSGIVLRISGTKTLVS